jgi:organic hydroperoxide reductase OsmC/OhrA
MNAPGSWTRFALPDFGSATTQTKRHSLPSVSRGALVANAISIFVNVFWRSGATPGSFMLVASLSSCHMLWYLHLCSVNHLTVLEYRDAASGVLEERDDSSGEFVRVVLRPTVKMSAGADQARALALHGEAHRLCFIARSVRFPVDTAPEIKEEAGQPPE